MKKHLLILALFLIPGMACQSPVMVSMIDQGVDINAVPALDMQQNELIRKDIAIETTRDQLLTIDLSNPQDQTQQQSPIDSSISNDQSIVDQQITMPMPDALTPSPCVCFEGNGSYCSANVQAYAQQENCIAPNEAFQEQALLSCQDGQWQLEQACDHGCISGETSGADECALPICECFVRVAWCGASAGRHGQSELNCQVPLIPEHDNDILGCQNGQWIVKEACENGCVEEATGTPDYCRASQSNEAPNWPACEHHATLLANGLHPEASDRLRCAGVTAAQISQTIGNAPASAGYHAADGTADGHQYCAAVDIRTRNLNEQQILALLDALGRNGFAAWYRQPGSDGWPANQSPHIHAVFAGIRMKAQLREQVRDFLVNKNGLSSHRIYRFWTIPQAIKDHIRTLFLRHYTP